MGNLIDYLRWRGDLSFALSPFNELDAAVFALLSYVNLAGIVPGWETGSETSLCSAAEQVFTRFGATGPNSKPIPELILTLNAKFNSNIEELLRTLEICPRYSGVRVSRFEDNIDTQVGEQFAALTFSLPEAYPEHVVAFRGTDNTLVGWKEDFGFAYLEQIPAQESAQKYLERAMLQLDGQFVLCGHSKGGNLAVYAAAHVALPDQQRVTQIYNFDGPGFNFELLDRAVFEGCQEKVVNIVPQESMVGMLFEAVGKRVVVASLARYASQHNTFFWNAERTAFLRGELADAGKMFDSILNSWVSELALPERQVFLEALFDLLGDMEDSVISFDPRKNLAYIQTILKKYKQLDPQTRALINQVFGTLSAETRRTLSIKLQEKLPREKLPHHLLPRQILPRQLLPKIKLPRS